VDAGGEEVDEGHEALAAGDFDAFFRRHFAAVARTAALVVRDFGEGEEIAQESFTRLFARWERMQSNDHARNFVFKVAVNMARSHLRKAARMSRDALSEAQLPEVKDESGNTADRVVLDRALSTLSPKQRAAVVLVDYAGYDAAAAARLLKTRPSTVRVHLARARRALGVQLAMEEES